MINPRYWAHSRSFQIVQPPLVHDATKRGTGGFNFWLVIRDWTYYSRSAIDCVAIWLMKTWRSTMVSLHWLLILLFASIHNREIDENLSELTWWLINHKMKRRLRRQANRMRGILVVDTAWLPIEAALPLRGSCLDTICFHS